MESLEKNQLTSLLTLSITVNLSFLMYGLIVKFFDPPHEDPRLITEKEEISERKSRKDLKRRSRAIAKSCCKLLFSIMLPTAGFYLFISTNISTNPFFEFNKAFEVVFGIQLAFYVFSISLRIFGSQDLLQYLHELLHHAIAIALYINILFTRNDALLGLIGLFMNGNLVFYELKSLLKVCVSSRCIVVYRATVFLVATSTCVFRIIFPTILLTVPLAFSHKQLFLMDSMSVAFFFLSVIFFAVYNIWYVKHSISKSFKEIQRHAREGCSKEQRYEDFAWDGCDVKVNTWGSTQRNRRQSFCDKKGIMWDGNLTKRPRVENEYTFCDPDHIFWPPVSQDFVDSKNVFVEVDIDNVNDNKMQTDQF